MARTRILPPPTSTMTLSWASLTQHPRVHEMLGSILTGVALGLVVLLILSAYPGEPFDYSKPDGGRTKREGAMAVGGKLKTEEEEEEDMDKVEVRVAADGCGTTFGSSSSSGSISGMTTTTTTTTSVRHRRSHSKNDSKSTRGRNGSSSSSSSEEHDGLNHAKTEALHRLLVQEDRVWQRLQHWPPALRGILGLSEDGVRMAVRQAARGRDGGKEVQQQEEGGSAAAAAFRLDSSRLSSRVDLIFYLLAFPALIYVINMEYGHVATRLFAHYFLKEAAVLGV